MNKFRIALSLVVATGAVLFALRHRALRQLHTEQKQLEQQSNEVSNLQAAVAQTKAAASVSTNVGLSTAERSELLRLRGQIGGLREELARATNQLAKISRAPHTVSSDASNETVASRQELTQRMNRGKQWMIALIMYAEDHGKRLPATLAEAAPLGGPAQNPDEFEFVQSGDFDLGAMPAPSRTLVLREKQPWKATGSGWRRIYAFADGHIEVASSDTGDFTEWERMKTAPVHELEPGSPQF
jgi:hypothetical protein